MDVLYDHGCTVDNGRGTYGRVRLVVSEENGGFHWQVMLSVDLEELTQVYPKKRFVSTL
jgi:hypothetical protein